MKIWPFTRAAATAAKEERGASLENPAISLADPRAYEAIFGSWDSAAGVSVTPDVALSVSAVWCAVNFISSTIAALPLILYRKGEEGRSRAEDLPLYGLLHDQVNEDFLTSFQWRKQAMVATLIYGRSYSFIERNRAGRVMNLWPLDPRKTSVQRRQGRRVYLYEENGKKFEYGAAEILDIPYMVGPDGLSTVDPISKLRNAVGLSVALETYASKFFQNGGVPPVALQGPLGSPAANSRAAKDIESAIKRANDEQRNVLTMPTGFQLKPIGYNPASSQLVEARRFQVEEVARMYNLPPVFLQDLTTGTYSNTEQQDLNFVKHTLTQWLECWEGELNCKLFPSSNRINFVEFNVDGLLRGDFATRMAGYATGIQNAVLKPNEARAMENRPNAHGGDELFIQGATVPITDGDALSGANAPKPNVKLVKPKPTPAATDLDPQVDLTGSDDE